MERADGRLTLDTSDFEEVYQNAKIPFFDVQFETPPWDIGGPQPVITQLVTDGKVTSEVLDIGCGLGENALFLASEGYRVTGLDASSTAIEKATATAADRGVDVDFAVADATRLDGYDGRFSTVVDSALYHCLPAEKQPEYVEALHRATTEGARLHIFCFSDAALVGMPPELSITEENLRTTVGARWTITRLEMTAYTIALTSDGFAAMVAQIAPNMSADKIASIERDDQDRLRLPVWQLEAIRA